MRSRFASNLAVGVLGGVLATLSLTLRPEVVQWLALGFGIAAQLVTLAAFLARGRGMLQRGIDVAVMVLGAWTIVVAGAFTGHTLRWLSFASAAGFSGLALIGLVGHEARMERSLRLALRGFAGDGSWDGGRRGSRSDREADPGDAPGIRLKGPLSNSYIAAVALVVFALIPYLALTSALNPLLPLLSNSLHLSRQALELTTGMANAAYAFGTVLAVQFAVHLRGRRMLLLYAALFVAGSVLAAAAPTPGLFIAGHVLQGLTTSLMLIAAVPALVVGWPASKMPWTGVIMNLCIFGAVALGPVIGGVQAGAHQWRPLFWIVAGVGALAVLFAILTFEDQPPQDRSAPWDWVAIVLAGGGSAAGFFGASELLTHRMLDPMVIIPLLGGLLMIVALVAYEYGSRHPLMPVRQIATTFPVAGVTLAMCAGAASVGLVTLAQTGFQTRATPTHLGMLFWPEFGAAVAAAGLFGLLFRTRFVPILAVGGMPMLAAGAAVLSGVAHGPDTLVLVGSGLVGLGVGASVSPALFIAGFSLRSAQIQRVFALIELLRGVAAFIAAPLLLHLAMTVKPKLPAGIGVAVWVCLGIAAGGGLVAVYLFALGRVRLQRPDLERWQEGEEPAWGSPPLAAGIRGRLATQDPRQRILPQSVLKD